MPAIVEQEKELRFTRAAQAAVFWVLASVSLMAAVILGVVSLYRPDFPALPHPAWALIPLAIGIASARLAVHLTKHAYLILTPLGIDLFPFFRPAKNMRTIFWQEIKAIDVSEENRTLLLHFNDERTSGIFLSLRPIRMAQRKLLAVALRGRLSGNDA